MKMITKIEKHITGEIEVIRIELVEAWNDWECIFGISLSKLITCEH